MTVLPVFLPLVAVSRFLGRFGRFRFPDARVELLLFAGAGLQVGSKTVVWSRFRFPEYLALESPPFPGPSALLSAATALTAALIWWVVGSQSSAFVTIATCRGRAYSPSRRRGRAAPFGFPSASTHCDARVSQFL